MRNIWAGICRSWEDGGGGGGGLVHFPGAAAGACGKGETGQGLPSFERELLCFHFLHESESTWDSPGQKAPWLNEFKAPAWTTSPLGGDPSQSPCSPRPGPLSGFRALRYSTLQSLVAYNSSLLICQELAGLSWVVFTWGLSWLQCRWWPEMGSLGRLSKAASHCRSGAPLGRLGELGLRGPPSPRPRCAGSPSAVLAGTDLLRGACCLQARPRDPGGGGRLSVSSLGSTGMASLTS